MKPLVRMNLQERLIMVTMMLINRSTIRADVLGYKWRVEDIERARNAILKKTPMFNSYCLLLGLSKDEAEEIYTFANENNLV